METKQLLMDEVQAEIEALGEIEIGSKEHQAAVDSVAKLMDRAIEMEKIETERQDRIEAREEENRVKMEQIRSDKKDRAIKNGLTAAGIIIPTAVTIWGTIKSLKFEVEGTVTTIMGRGFIQKLLPKK